VPSGRGPPPATFARARGSPSSAPSPSSGSARGLPLASFFSVGFPLSRGPGEGLRGGEGLPTAEGPQETAEGSPSDRPRNDLSSHLARGVLAALTLLLLFATPAEAHHVRIVRSDRGATARSEVDHASLAVELPPLAPGAYTVTWRVTSQADGEFNQGAFDFTLGPDLGAGWPDRGRLGTIGLVVLVLGALFMLGDRAPTHNREARID
jgi:hypothetical protein